MERGEESSGKKGEVIDVKEELEAEDAEEREGGLGEIIEGGEDLDEYDQGIEDRNNEGIALII
jgi:hypothetical protein